jgi:alkaline phosphatase
LVNALRNKVYSLEADVYLVNGELKVAHDRRDLASAPSLDSLYLQPIIDLFKTNHGRVSTDNNYAPLLLIDVKENGEAALRALTKCLSLYPSVFDRRVNRAALQVVISGDRGNPSQWTSWPSFILFDGRVNEQYNKAQMERVAFFSDSFANYTRQKANTDSLIKQLAEKVHYSGKLLRLWAIPDNPSGWMQLRQFGVDIVNTDKVTECRAYFSAHFQ